MVDKKQPKKQVKGHMYTKKAKEASVVRDAKWLCAIINLIMLIVMVGLVILLLLYLAAGAVAMVVYVALVLLMYAIADVYMFWQLRKLKKSVVK